MKFEINLRCWENLKILRILRNSENLRILEKLGKFEKFENFGKVENFGKFEIFGKFYILFAAPDFDRGCGRGRLVCFAAAAELYRGRG